MGLVGSVVSLQASACAFTDLKSASSSEQQEAFIQFAAGIGVAPAESARPSSAANFIIQRGPHLPIVGLWKFAFTATDGSPIDWGFQTWHSDGTEITNSGGRPAEVGNFCMGVWQQAGDGGYSLNHWAIAWGPPPNFDPTVLAGLVNIREVVYINRTGNSMSGTVSEELYAPDGVTPITSLGNGTVSGTRITP
jgi:hypothetical protein